jgi:hypothetical protein
VIIDKSLHCTWILLTKAKGALVKIVEMLLEQHENKNATHCALCADKGSALRVVTNSKQQ